jgi:hypothetical protein
VTNTDAQRIAALNQLTAACEAAAPALKAMSDMFGDNMSPEVRRMLAAINTYQACRTGTDRGRDVFLSRFPTAEVMQDELNRRQTERPAS